MRTFLQVIERSTVRAPPLGLVGTDGIPTISAAVTIRADLTEVIVGLAVTALFLPSLNYGIFSVSFRMETPVH